MSFTIEVLGTAVLLHGLSERPFQVDFATPKAAEEAARRALTLTADELWRQGQSAKSL